MNWYEIWKQQPSTQIYRGESPKHENILLKIFYPKMQMRGFDDQSRKHGKYSREPLEKNVRFYQSLKKDREEAKRNILRFKQREDDEEKLCAAKKRLLLTNELLKTYDKKGRSELTYRHGEKIRGRTWSMEGFLVHERRWKKGQVVLEKKWSPGGFVSIKKGDRIIHKNGERVVIKRVV